MTDQIHTITMSEEAQAAFASGWNMAIKAAAKACSENGMSSIAGEQAIRALSMPAPTQGWKTIDSAPKDGTAALLWPGLLVWTEEMMPACGWFALGSGKWVSQAGWLEPTHWQPLPQPPGGV